MLFWLKRGIFQPLDAHSLLRPEAIEAWFYLYRITGMAIIYRVIIYLGDKMYQEWGWKAFQSIEKYAKLAVGYSSVNSVKRIPVTYRSGVFQTILIPFSEI